QALAHLTRANITHVYLSPIFAATEGSTHGYDVTDHNVIDPTLGGMAGFLRFCAAAKAHGLKLLLDIVPNHMAASSQNGWWRDVLKNGAFSPYAHHFDIDWSAPRLVIPVLGKPYGEALADGDITRADHPVWGPVLRVPGHDLPLRPGTEGIDDPHRCHEAQHYRLTHWRLGRDGLTYRRFFEITGLVGVRVEEEAVFDDVHRLTLDLIRDGHVHALRVDHVDGLADPKAYLERLSEVSGVPILVEKILEGEEALRPWPVVGTTGYEFMAAMAALFTHPKGLRDLKAAYSTLAEDDPERLIAAAKEEIARVNLAGELEALTEAALALFAEDLSLRDHGKATVRDGLVALLCAARVYRSYIDGAVAKDDRAVWQEALANARETHEGRAPVVGDLAHLIVSPREDQRWRDFITRVQQMTGPLMAKAVEDTVFYRHRRLIGLAEVGGELDPDLGPDRLLKVANTDGLAATQTHDTKRGEDARARLYALSDPAAAALWSTVWPSLPGDVPEGLRWGLGQMLFAARPLDDDPAFVERFCDAALKGVREAKEETSWIDIDPAYEARVLEAADAMARSSDSLAPLKPVWRAGAVIGLSQALLKTLTRPRPDIYQGTFGWDFAMVDPDNRRPVDFCAESELCERALSSSLDTLIRSFSDGAVKARVLLEGLAVRQELSQALQNIDVQAIPITGDGAGGLFGLACKGADRTAIAVVATKPLAVLDQERLTIRPEALANASIVLDGPFVERFSGAELPAGPVALAPFFGRFPVFLAVNRGL
ncbi:MAG: malto-oligosyltrehalose synthase, partial [Pseudomonadota bacterium]